MARRNLHDKEYQKLMMTLDWMTESLVTEVKNHSPTYDDMIIDKASGEYSYKPESFEKACETVFAKGREFLNWLQFREFGFLFLSKWNITGNMKQVIWFVLLRNLNQRNQKELHNDRRVLLL